LVNTVTVLVPANMPGAEWTCEALGTGFNTIFGVTGTGAQVTVASTKRARCKVAQNGTDMVRVSADQ
jgi:hypothetical protein